MQTRQQTQQQQPQQQQPQQQEQTQQGLQQIVNKQHSSRVDPIKLLIYCSKLDQLVTYIYNIIIYNRQNVGNPTVYIPINILYYSDGTASFYNINHFTIKTKDVYDQLIKIFPGTVMGETISHVDIYGRTYNSLDIDQNDKNYRKQTCMYISWPA
jgi:hypothetical protein